MLDPYKHFNNLDTVEKTMINVASFYFIFGFLILVGWFVNLFSIIDKLTSENIQTVGDITIFTAFQIAGFFLIPIGGILGWVIVFI